MLAYMFVKPMILNLKFKKNNDFKLIIIAETKHFKLFEKINFYL